jgi:hypothetical protein
MPLTHRAIILMMAASLSLPLVAASKTEAALDKPTEKTEKALDKARAKAAKAVEKASVVIEKVEESAEVVNDKAVETVAKAAGVEVTTAPKEEKPAKPFISAEIEGYFATGSKYDEYPKEGSTDQKAGSRVYGDLPATYGNIKVEGRLWRFWLADAGYRLGSFSKSKMNLKQQTMGPGVRADIENDIDGRATAWNLDLIVRPLEFGKTWRNKLDCFVGYESADATKEFYDGRGVGNPPAYPGNFGRFKINYKGAYLGLRGQYEIIKGLSVGASILGTPWLSNSTTVEGSHLAATINDTATGRRYRWDAGLNYAILGGPVELGAGYRYEDIYFDATATAYSLEIIYAGPYVKAGVRF